MTSANYLSLPTATDVYGMFQSICQFLETEADKKEAYEMIDELWSII